jgi:nickel/cobalt exporter
VRRLLAPLVALAALAVGSDAEEHPLGNFSVNSFSRIQVGGDRVYVRYVVDLAEIPTLQAGRIDGRRYAARIAGNLRLRVDDRPASLTPVARRLTRRPGAGGLATTRLEILLGGPRLAGRSRIVYADGNFAGRVGWREIVIGARTPSRSDELRSYPDGLLESPLAATAIATTLSPRPGVALAPSLRAPQAPARRGRGFESLVSRELSPGFVLLSLALALFWGAAHALGPGHGKAIVAGYLVGTRGTARHAFLLGLIVTVTHTIGVFALGLATLALSQLLLPEDLYPWLNLVSALLVLAVGVAVVRWRLRDLLHARAHARGGPHSHHHHHHHEHDHEHAPVGGLRSLIGAGVSGGIVPCPTALVVLLAAVSLQRIGYGLVLIVAFSVGLAATVTGIGLIAVSAKRLFARAGFDGRLVRTLPAVSAAVVLALGLLMTARALPPLV